LINEQKERPASNARDDVLMQIRRYQKRVMKDTKWSKPEKEELMKFLGFQATSWGMLEDDLGSTSVKLAKEKMLLETWRKFTEGMKTRKPKRKKASKNKTDKSSKPMEAAEPESAPSTSGTIVQGNVKTVNGGIETPVGEERPMGQTDSHEESASKESHAKEMEISNVDKTKLKQ
jgi:hypothetical protein